MVAAVSIAFVSTALLALSNTSRLTMTATEPLRRLPTFRSLSSTLSDASKRSSGSIEDRAAGMTQRAQQLAPLTNEEICDLIHSVQNIAPVDHFIDYDELDAILRSIAHLSHKDWSVTGDNAEKLRSVLFPSSVDLSPASPQRQLLERILTDGNWDAAAQYAASSRNGLPWAVLVTGVNGIRKTTSMYQDWFPQLLQEALVPPPSATATDFDLTNLPTGRNSFFRQLDHMIATLCNEDFALLYQLTSELLQEADTDSPPPPSTIQKYTDLKAAIFARYRTLSELLGAMLLREAQLVKSNCLMETSGKDVAMFHYIDHFFPSGYHKLALHFTINDLSLACASVDARMVGEIYTGVAAIAKESVFDVINSNAGGPYGSNVLADIQAASDQVWRDEVESGKVGEDWYKAVIQINARSDGPWTAQAVRPDQSLGTEFVFPKQ